MDSKIQLIQRPDGSWLAVTGKCEVVHIGVVADSRETAERELAATLDRWIELLHAV